jgi:hypothetical protein
VYLNKLRIFTYFIRKITFPSLYKGENRFQNQWLDQDERMSIAKPIPILIFLCHGSHGTGVSHDSALYLLPEGEKTPENLYYLYRIQTLDLENSESPTFTQSNWKCPTYLGMSQYLLPLLG